MIGTNNRTIVREATKARAPIRRYRLDMEKTVGSLVRVLLGRYQKWISSQLQPPVMLDAVTYEAEPLVCSQDHFPLPLP